jgi:hypothetical protein
VEKLRFPSCIVMFRSKKCVVVVSSSISHSKVDQLFKVCLNAVQVLCLLAVGGSHMPKISSM